MSGYVKRIGERSIYEAPIVWADFNTDNFCRGKICNSSNSGMCFETDCTAEAETNIRIKTLHYLPDTAGPEAYRFYEAKVKWCRGMPAAKIPRYGIGVQYLVKSENVEGPDHPCSLCGDIIPYGNIHCVEEFVYLCSPCFKHYRSLPEGMIKKGVMDFLIGNVI